MTKLFLISHLVIFQLFYLSYSQNSPVCPQESCGPVLWPDGLAHGWDDLSSKFGQLIFEQSYDKCVCKTLNFGSLDMDMLIPDQMKVSGGVKKIKEYNGLILSSEDLQKTADILQFELSDKKDVQKYIKARGVLSETFIGWKNEFHKHGKAIRRLSYSAAHFEGHIDANIGLHAEFDADVTTALEKEKKGSKSAVTDEIQKLIIKYGTHYIDKALFGAIGFRDQFLKGFTKLSGIKKEKFTTTGSTDPVKKNLTVAQWRATELMDVQDFYFYGDFLYKLVDREEFSEFPAAVRKSVKDEWHDATVDYYKKNIVSGCTKFSADNYNSKANVDDGSCSSASYLKFSEVFLALQLLLTFLFPKFFM